MLRFLIPKKKRIFLLILLLFRNFEGNRARNDSKISMNKYSEIHRKRGKENEKRNPKSWLKKFETPRGTNHGNG